MRHEMIAGYRLYCLDELGKAAKWPRAASFLVFRRPGFLRT